MIYVRRQDLFDAMRPENAGRQYPIMNYSDFDKRRCVGWQGIILSIGFLALILGQLFA